MTRTRDKQKLADQALRLRRHVVEMVYQAGSGHPGGSLGMAEVFVSLYLAGELNIRPEEPKWPDRDRFVLSKGHICPGYYAALAIAGYFSEDLLPTFRKLGSPLQGHPCMLKGIGIDISSGSLGQGLSVANGMAIAGKLDGKSYRVYVMLGDGEVQEGQVWEAAMSSAHHRLDNVCAILDYNDLQIDGKVSEIMDVAPLAGKWKAFGWNVIEIDGNDFDQIFDAFDQARATEGTPTIIIARTIKGKGVSFMENACEWHGKAPNEEQYKQAMSDLGVQATV